MEQPAVAIKVRDSVNMFLFSVKIFLCRFNIGMCMYCPALCGSHVAEHVVILLCVISMD